MSERLIETASWTPQTKVDRDAGVIRNVKILGFQSKNGRDYSPAAVRKALAMYEGLGVNLNHRKPTDRPSDRRVEDHFGQLRSCKIVENDGVYGDLHYLKSHSEAERICERAERFPDELGMSHDASGVTKPNRKTKRKTVESIDDVLSVDVVRYPATTEGLFESEDQQMAEPLKEVNGGMLPADMIAADVAPAVAAENPETPTITPEEAARIGFIAEISAILEGGGTLDEIKSAIAAAVAPSDNPDGENSEGDGGDNPGNSDMGSENGEKDESTSESVQESIGALNRRLDMFEALDAAGIDRSRLSPKQSQLLAQQPNRKSMDALIESWPPVMRYRQTAAPPRARKRTTSYDDLRKELIPAD